MYDASLQRLITATRGRSLCFSDISPKDIRIIFQSLADNDFGQTVGEVKKHWRQHRQDRRCP
ncbi:hypothetical protein [Calothrix sp. FACHB-1219]|uniref:hypothetical protein n=1 Tax=unclassified Calothrix TaxID=2619626 RepID=UPI00403F9971